MKYILNESKVKTTNGFNINNIKLDLEIPNIDISKEYSVSSNSIQTIKNNYSSPVGLKHDSYLNVDIDILEDTYITYEFNNNTLASIINLNIKNDSNIYIKFISDNKSINFNDTTIKININNNIKANISIINLLNNNSKSFISLDGDINNSSNVLINFIDLGGDIRVNNINLNSLTNSYLNINSIFVGMNKDIVDTYYYLTNKEEKSNVELKVQGAISDEALSQFRGIIDFIRGASSSVGKENANIVLLSDSCKSRSMPVLLCGEEDVIGEHGVSTGKIDKDTLFYLMSRGLTEKEAIALVVKSNFDKLLKDVNDEKIIEEINDYLNSMLK